jgi:hypothetical protein
MPAMRAVCVCMCGYLVHPENPQTIQSPFASHLPSHLVTKLDPLAIQNLSLLCNEEMNINSHLKVFSY